MLESSRELVFGGCAIVIFLDFLEAFAAKVFSRSGEGLLVES